MDIFAVFEMWHLGDGNYPPLKKGQLVNLSFEIEPDELVVGRNTASRFHHCGQAEYEFTGAVSRVYNEGSSEQLVVIASDHFCFYVCSQLTEGLKPGDTVFGRGTLALDHYLWVEFLPAYVDLPDLFYRLRVIDICRARIPERFIVRSGVNVSLPTRVRPEDYGPDDLSHVEAIPDSETAGEYASFIVQFSDLDVPPGPIPRTFIQ